MAAIKAYYCKCKNTYTSEPCECSACPHYWKQGY